MHVNRIRGGAVYVILVEQHTPALICRGGADRGVEGKLHHRVAGCGVVEGQPGLCRRNDSIEIVTERADLNLPVGS